jgi:hypothetical protein
MHVDGLYISSRFSRVPNIVLDVEYSSGDMTIEPHNHHAGANSHRLFSFDQQMKFDCHYSKQEAGSDGCGSAQLWDR